MQIEQKENRIYKPQSKTTLSAEETNQVTTELENVIAAGGLTPSAGTLTQVRDAVQNIVNTALNTGLATKQDTLVSGTNIKTVNGNSLLGNGNVNIDTLPSQTGQSGKFLTTNGTDPSWAEIPTDVDNKSVSLNSNDEIQTVGVIDQNNTTKAIKTWTGTKAQYDAIATKDNDTLYYTPENIIPNKAIYVVYEWKQGKDWCRVWSDGWCEQGGYCPQSGGTLTSPVTVNLHREMRDTNYTILFTRTAATTTQNVTGHVGSAVDWTTTSFTYAFTGGSGHCMWEVKGYCAEVPNAGSSVVSWAEAADRNLSNLTTTGKIVGAGLAMPSDRYINLTLGASETTYTAPANGWFLLYFHTATSGDRWAQLVNGSKNDFVNRISANIASDFSICLPVTKGDIVLLQYANINLAYSWNKFRFYYAVGSESEAN